MRDLKIKVCGMRDADNIHQLKELNLHYMGFIFFPKSSRFVTEIDEQLLGLLSPIKKTAVFVNSSLEDVKSIAHKYAFEVVQLHGQESPAYCQALKEEGFEVIKAFGIQDGFDWEIARSYQEVVDYFLFDTFTKIHGGSGKTFNWDMLKGYSLAKPYFLSGGIGPEEMERAFELEDERLYGLDLNSRFEVSPGLKDIELLKTVLKKKI